MAASENESRMSQKEGEKDMICCKIAADFGANRGEFAALCHSLCRKGSLKYQNGAMYFADVENPSTGKPFVARCLRKAGYPSFYICEYDKDNRPNEPDADANAWLADKLIKMNYRLCEEQSQKSFREISKGLDILEAEMARIRGEGPDKEEP